MKIILHYSNGPAFTLEDHQRKGLGGTENYISYTAKTLAKLGHDVWLYNLSNIAMDIHDVKLRHIHAFKNEGCDLFISFRMRDIFKRPVNAKHKVLILADTESDGLGDDVRAGRIDSVVSVSEWQKNKIAKEENLVDHPCWIVSSNGIDMNEFTDYTDLKQNICIHTSTPERGLGLLLDMWPEIHDRVSEKTIAPSLHLFSSFYGWGVTKEENENMCKELYAKAKELEGYCVINHIHADSVSLRQYQQEAEFFLYPTNFNETYCISLTEVMAAGCIPIISNRAAPAERVNKKNGFLVGDYEHDAYSPKNRKLFIDTAVKAMLTKEDKLYNMRQEAIKTASKHNYSVIIPALLEELVKRF